MKLKNIIENEGLNSILNEYDKKIVMIQDAIKIINTINVYIYYYIRIIKQNKQYIEIIIKQIII